MEPKVVEKKLRGRSFCRDFSSSSVYSNSGRQALRKVDAGKMSGSCCLEIKTSLRCCSKLSSNNAKMAFSSERSLRKQVCGKCKERI